MFFKGKKIEHSSVPQHIAIIMDGNGRWAKKRGMPRGHSAGAKKFKEIARYCNKIGVKYLTVYAFSTENWKRPKEEVDGIMNLLRDYLKDSSNFKGENIKLRFIGNIDALPEDIQQLIENACRDSDDATGMTACLAVNYGGKIFRTEALSITDWLILAGITSPVLIIGELVRACSRKS